MNPDPRTVELLDTLLTNGTRLDHTDRHRLIGMLTGCPGLLIVPADTARTGVWFDHEDGVDVVHVQMGAPFVKDADIRVIVAPDPRVEAS